MLTREFTCIVCPRSCRITVHDDNGKLHVSGNSCKQGETYALDEYTAPKRMLTTTVAITNAHLERLPVISSAPVPKALLRDCLQLLYAFEAVAPVKQGDILFRNILDTGVDILAARDLQRS